MLFNAGCNEQYCFLLISRILQYTILRILTSLFPNHDSKLELFVPPFSRYCKMKKILLLQTNTQKSTKIYLSLSVADWWRKN